MNQWHELHLLGPNDPLNNVTLVIVILQIRQVLVCRDKDLVAKLCFQVNSQSLNSVPHGVGGLHSRQVLEELGVDPHVWWLLVEVVLV